MAVFLANDRLGLRRQIEGDTTDRHGGRKPAGWGPVVALEDGRVRERGDGAWALALDPVMWPVRTGDLVVAEDGREWLVTGSTLLQNNHDHRVDWVRVEANQRSGGGTEPGGAWFVGRYEVPGTRSTDDGQTLAGHGPPPATLQTQPGATYHDLDTGEVYQQGDGA